jgi:phenylacetate-CoA oxygenase, PaaJ subunit
VQNGNMIDKQTIYQYLQEVVDPEVPVLTIEDLGIIRDIHVSDDNKVEVVITPTYSGCPAMNTITTNIRFCLMGHGIQEVVIKEVLSPAWTTDWMSDDGKKKLKEYGIAPPQYLIHEEKINITVPCPRCNTENTKLISQFGSTACKALYQCNECLEPFDYFKCH